MVDPRMMAASMPAQGGMGGPQDAAMGMQQDPSMQAAGMGGAPMSAVEAVVMALQGMQMQRKGENDALMMAVLQATGAMPRGIDGVVEGSPMAVPDEDTNTEDDGPMGQEIPSKHGVAPKNPAAGMGY